MNGNHITADKRPSDPASPYYMGEDNCDWCGENEGTMTEIDGHILCNKCLKKYLFYREDENKN